jgi:hypothetical protein
MSEQAHGEHAIGSLLRQPTVRRPDGRECRLDDLLGRGFAVVSRKQSDLRMGSEGDAILRRLGGRAIGLDGVSVTEGEHDGLFDTHPAVVLRPDRYVFGVVDAEWDLDRLLAELSRKLYLNSGTPGASA